jgi:hypothetical protein
MNLFHVVGTEFDTGNGEIPKQCLIHLDMIIRFHSIISFRRQPTLHGNEQMGQSHFKDQGFSLLCAPST